MYTEKDLMEYEYFFNVLSNEKIEYVIDPLTKVINKPHFISLVNYLIKDNAPNFSLGLIDLDNFNFIVDNYGKKVGDEIISTIAEDLQDFIGDNGLVGRYGGDEFLFIYFDLYEYDKMHDMLDELYKKVLRRTVNVDDLSILVTGTTGIATYPKDAKKTDDLLELADKTLFRGKMKGRNCYIIYVEEKHKDIKIEPLGLSDTFKIFYNLKKQYLSTGKLKLEKLVNLSAYIKKTLSIPILIYIDNNDSIYDCNLEKKIGKLKNKFNVDGYGLYEINTLEDMHQNMDVFDILGPLDIKSFLLIETKVKNKKDGYLIFADKKNKYWNPNEKAALFYIADLMEE